MITDDERPVLDADGVRTCRMEYDTVHCDYVCTSCGERYDADMYISISGDDRHFFKPMRYCPNCGARVMDE